MSKLTEKEMQYAVWEAFNKGWDTACVNVFAYPWESDLLGITKAGYSVEYEVKRSVSDFRADARKEGFQVKDLDFTGPGSLLKFESKYKSLQAGKGPSRFYYVFPEDLDIDTRMVPDWAGIVTVSKQHFEGNDEGVHWERDIYSVKQLRPARRLSNKKVSESVLKAISRSQYWRLFKNLI